MTTANALDNSNRPIRDRGYNFQVASHQAMGAGQIDPNRVLDPGFIYDTTSQDVLHASIFCATCMNYSKKQIIAITRSKNYTCSETSSDLNYPSVIAFTTILLRRWLITSSREL